jgi:hypothetical protein
MLQPTSSADEMAEHLDRVPPIAMFVSQDLLPLGQEVFERSSLSSEVSFYRLLVPDTSADKAAVESDRNLAKIPSLDDLIESFKGLPSMHKTPLLAGEASRRVAYYCTTSGTSGLQVTMTRSPAHHTKLTNYLS